MKKLFFVSALFLLGTVFAQSQDREVYVAAMQAGIEKIGTCQSPVDFLNVINQFERIGNVNQDEWLPDYWAAYSYAMASYYLPDVAAKDQYLQKAEDLVAGIKQGKANDELLVLEAFLAQSRMNVDPQNRFATYGSKANLLLEQALEINPENPRIYNLKGRSIFYTPEQFGGGKVAARPLLELALAKYGAFNLASAIHPSWGEDYTQDLYRQCETNN